MASLPTHHLCGEPSDPPLVWRALRPTTCAAGLAARHFRGAEAPPEGAGVGEQGEAEQRLGGIGLGAAVAFEQRPVAAGEDEAGAGVALGDLDAGGHAQGVHAARCAGGRGDGR